MAILKNKPTSLVPLQIIRPFEKPTLHGRFQLGTPRLGGNTVAHFLNEINAISYTKKGVNYTTFYTSSILSF